MRPNHLSGVINVNLFWEINIFLSQEGRRGRGESHMLMVYWQLDLKTVVYEKTGTLTWVRQLSNSLRRSSSGTHASPFHFNGLRYVASVEKLLEKLRCEDFKALWVVCTYHSIHSNHANSAQSHQYSLSSDGYCQTRQFVELQVIFVTCSLPEAASQRHLFERSCRTDLQILWWVQTWWRARIWRQGPSEHLLYE